LLEAVVFYLTIKGEVMTKISLCCAVLSGLSSVHAVAMEVATALLDKRLVRIVNQMTSPIKVRTRQQFNLPNNVDAIPPMSEWVILDPDEAVKLEYLSNHGYYDSLLRGEREYLRLTVEAYYENDQKASAVKSLSFATHNAPGYNVLVYMANGEFAMQASATQAAASKEIKEE
jgi:hypothetical protein